jgi:4-amino-4-deoxy-L-arabinose transferase-like glycosyltransferase
MVHGLILFCKQMSERQKLLLLLIVAFGLRLYAVLMARAIAVDSAFYGFMARDFIRNDYVKGLSQPFHPFYPLLIALIAPDTAHVEIAGRLISLVLGTATLLLVYYLAKEVVDQKAATFAALFYCFHPHLVTFSGMFLSEATYWFLLTLSVFLFWIGLKRNKILEWISSGFFLALAYLTRPEGIGYLVVFVVWILIAGGLRKGWGKKIVLVSGLLFVFAVFALPYVIYVHHETGRWMISKKAQDAQTRLLVWTTEGKGAIETGAIRTQTPPRNGWRVPGPVRNMVRYGPSTAYRYLRGYHYALWIFLLFGLIRKRQQDVQAELFLASIILFHILSLATFTSSSQRFSVPVVPLSLFWAGAGVLTFRGFLKRNIPSLEKWLVGWIIVTLLFQLVQGLQPERKHREEQRQIGLWLKEVTPKDAVIMSNSPIEAFYAEREFLSLSSGTSTIKGKERTYPEIMESARAKGVRYILINQDTPEDNPHFVRSIETSDLKEIFRKDRTVIYEVSD